MAAFISVTPSSSTLTWAQSQLQALPLAMAATGGAGNPTPTGTVTLTTGSYSSGAIALVGGNARVSIPPGTLAMGFNTLDVSYSGDSNYAPVSVAGSAVAIVGASCTSPTPARTATPVATIVGAAPTIMAVTLASRSAACGSIATWPPR